MMRRRGTRRPQSEGHWSKYLCIDPVQGVKVEKKASDNSEHGSHVCN